MQLTELHGGPIGQEWEKGRCITPPAPKWRWWDCVFCGGPLTPMILRGEPGRFVHGCCNCGAHGPIGTDWEDAAQKTALRTW